MDEYQNRRDIDKIYDDLYDQINGSLNVLTFMEDSPYRNVASRDDGKDRGTIDAIIDYYDLTSKGGGGGGDLSNYYTKTEINGILSSYVTNQTLEDYALKSELFSGSYEDLTDVPSSFPPSTHTHNWDSVTGKPSTFPPSTHTHDDRYYTETETDTLLSGKAPSNHTHDDRYYTESEIDSLLGGKAPSSHTHDESEITLEANHYNINTTPFPPDVYAETQDELNNYLYTKANINVPHTVAEIFTHIDTYYDYYQ